MSDGARSVWVRMKRVAGSGCQLGLRLRKMRPRDVVAMLGRIDVRKPVHAALIGVIVAGVLAPVLDAMATNARYQLAPNAMKVMEKPAPSLQSKLIHHDDKQATIFNESAEGAKDPISTDTLAATQGGGKKQLYTATLPDDPAKGVQVHDNTNDVTVSFTPQLSLMDGRSKGGHVVYPVQNQPAQMIFTPKANGLKEDIVLASAPSTDTTTYHYKLGVPDYVQPRLEDDGSIGFYTADQQFFGNISYGTPNDEKLVEKARQSNIKNYLMFKIPAPLVHETGDGQAVKAHFSLSGSDLSVYVSGLSRGKYPLSIDPTFLLNSTADWVLGSIDDNIDLSQANQVGRQPLVGGSTPGWTALAAPNLAYAQFAAGLVAYNGFLYLMGGGSGATTCTGDPAGPGGVPASTLANCTSGTTTNDVRYISLDSTTGALGTGTPNLWKQTSKMVNVRQGLVAFGFNGYLYAVGGEDNTGTPLTAANSVEFAKINADGSVGTWATTGHLNTARSYPAGTIYQGVLYVMGGSTAANNATPSSTLEYARVSGDGTIPASGAGAWTLSTSLATGSLANAAGTAVLARSKFRASAYNGFLYTTGGQTATTPNTAVLNTTQFAPINADGSVGAWANTTAFPTARRDQGMAINNGYIYVFAGCTGTTEPCGSFIKDMQYAVINADGSIGQWQSTLPYDSGFNDGVADYNTRMPAGVTSYSNHVYFVGGCSAETATNNCGTQLVGTFISNIDAVGRYDLGIQNVQTTPPFNNNGLTEAKAGGSSVALNGFLYYLGGCAAAGCDHYDSVVEKATLNNDGTLGAFTTTTALPAGSGDGAGRMGASVVAYNNKLYVIGGTERTTGGTFPAVTSVTNSAIAAGSGTHNVTLPGTIAAGDLLLAIVTVPGGTGVTITTPAGGWVAINTYTNGTTTKAAVYAKSALGTEGASVNFATTGTPALAAQVYRILAGNWLGGTPSASSIATANAAATGTTAPNPPSLTPTWGADDTLWIACACGDTFTGTPTVPTGFTTETNAVVGTGTSGANVATAILSTNTATEDPAAWTTVSATGEALTIAIAPPAETATVYMSTILSNTQNSDGTLSGTWTTETNGLPQARAFGTAVVWHNWIYYIGGLSNSTTVAPTGTSIYHAQITSNAPGSWTTTGTQLSHIRWGATGGIWGNWIYVIGGESDLAGTYATAANGIEQLTIANNGDITAESTQNPTGQFLTRLDGGFVRNGIIYTFGGVTSGSTAAVGTINWASLDPTTGAVGTWSNTNIGDTFNNTAGLATARSLATAVDYGGYFYVPGGCTSTLATTDFRGCAAFVSTAQSIEVNLPNNGGTGQTNAFTSSTGTSLLPTATADQAEVAYNGHLYSIGGCTGYTTGACTSGSNVTTIESAPINPDNSVGAWTTTGMTALPTGVSLEQAVAYNGFMYVLGGRSSAATATNTVWIAPISSTGTIGTWVNSSGNYLPAAVSSFGAAIARGYIYVAGGNNASGTKQSTVYYTKLNTSDGTLVQPTGTGCSTTWCSAALTALPTARAGLSFVSYNGALYAVGGADSTGNVNDVLFAATSATDGSISAWNSTTDVPRGMTFRQAVAANGFMYFIGNETDGTEVSYADINANGTLGLMQDSVPATNSTQVHGAAAFFAGDIYMVGGCTVSAGVCTTPATSVEYAGQQAIARVGHYSKLFNTQVNTAPSQIVMDGSLSGPGSQVALNFFTEQTGATSFGVAQLFNPVIFGTFYNVQALDSSGANTGVAFNYLIVLALDDSNSGTFPDVSSAATTNVSDFTLYYHANPGRRLRHGASFTDTGCNPTPANGCLLDTAP